jgi:cell division protein FtsN
MTPPPPPRVPAKPERSDARAGEAVRPGPRPTDARHDTAIRDIERIPASLAPALEPRFTVQVGAFKVRTQADALRARLAESGQDAYVDEGEVGGVPQYRVRVGTFITREAARDAAARLTAERHLATYVTTR